MKCFNFSRLERFFLISCLWAIFAPFANALDLVKQQPAGPVILTINGKSGATGTATSAGFDAAMLDSLPQKSFVTQTPWFKEPVKFSGPLLKDVLQAFKVKGGKLNTTALNDYKVDVPIDDALKYGAILARRMDGRVLTVRDKGPIWLMYPFDSHPEIKNLMHYGRCIWQLQTMTLE